MQGSQQTMSVEDYTRYFVKKIVKDEKFRDTSELHRAGTTFYALLQRFAREGDREDVRMPFKIMKDEFMNEWKLSCKEIREELIRRLFSVLDTVHEECQNSVQNCMNGTEVSYTILEEFRLRLMKMVVGDTWKEALPLRIEALKHMHKYRNRELDGYYTQESRKNTLKHRARHLTVKKLKRSVVGPAKSSWTAVFNELLLTSGARLAPLLFAILDENQAMEDRLLSIAPPKGMDINSIRGSMISSTKSSSSVSSSSVRMQTAEADNTLPITDEDSGNIYYKNLTNELNIKLQLFKQRGQSHVSLPTRIGSHESGTSSHQLSRGIDDETTTSKSEEMGSQGMQRSVTPFLDETPPPWCLSDAQTHLSEMQLSDGDAEPDSPPKAARKSMLMHTTSAKTTRMTESPKQLTKSPSCHTSNVYSFAFHPKQTTTGQPQPLPPPQQQQKVLSPQEYCSDRSHRLFESLDPLK